MDRYTERMLRNDIRLRTTPFYFFVLVAALSFVGVGVLAAIGYLAHLAQ